MQTKKTLTNYFEYQKPTKIPEINYISTVQANSGTASKRQKLLGLDRVQ